MPTAQTPRKLKRANVPDPLIPPRELAKRYVSRDVEGGVKDFELFDYARENHFPLLIEGPTGCGKTMAVEAYAASRRMRFQSVSCNAGVDPTQFWGRVIPDGEGGFVWQDGVVTDMARHGGVLLFNEINFLPERISTALFPLFDGRRMLNLLDHKGETIKAHDDLLLVMDMNPGYLGTRPLNAAFRNRQTIQTVWNYDPDVEKQLVPCDALRDIVAKIRASESFDTPVSTNMMIEFLSHASYFGVPYACENFTNHFRQEDRIAIRQILATDEVALNDYIDGLGVRGRKATTASAAKRSNWQIIA